MARVAKIGPAVRVGGDIGIRKRSSGDEAARVEGFGSRYHPSGRMSGRQGSNRRGERGLVSASLCPFSESLAMRVNRREFLVAGGAVALTALSAASLEGAPDRRKSQRVIYRFSVRGRRASRAAKAFCANLRFRTAKAAESHPKPHAGFNGRLVEVVVTSAEYQFLFTTRQPADVVDLRHLRNVKIIGLG